MELHHLAASTAPPAASPDNAAARPGPAFPDAVAESLSYLANLIDASIRIRGMGISVREWAASHLGIEPTAVALTTSAPSLLVGQLMALAFAEDLEAHVPSATIGSDQEEAPDWVKLELGEVTTRVPCELVAAYPAGGLILPPVVVQVTKPYHSPALEYRVYSKPEHVAAAEAYLEALRERGLTRTNPFKDRTLETITTQLGLTFKVLGARPTERADVVLPDRIWADIDRNVHGVYRALEQLRAADLACNRGLLLAGPPGTGKTALCRALAHELAGKVTVIFCDAATVQHQVRELYKQMKHLAPALIVMEDVDLVVGDRNHSASASLLDFLVALDGAMSDHQGVVTIATTNDPRSIDPAAKRSARFDVTIEVPAPDAGGRAAILRRYLRGLDASADVDIDRVAAVTGGLTGADLRELVSDAVLHAAGSDDGAPVTTTLLVKLALKRRSAVRTGFYL
jgi:cell division protease FtsH